MNTPLGRCPICAEALQEEGDLLVCPARDYRVKKKSFLDRWDKFDRLRATLQRTGTDVREEDGLSLLRDLQEMNIKEKP